MTDEGSLENDEASDEESSEDSEAHDEEAAETDDAGEESPEDAEESSEENEVANKPQLPAFLLEEDGDSDDLSEDPMQERRKKLLTATALIIGILLAAIAAVYLFTDFFDTTPRPIQRSKSKTPTPSRRTPAWRRYQLSATGATTTKAASSKRSAPAVSLDHGDQGLSA